MVGGCAIDYHIGAKLLQFLQNPLATFQYILPGLAEISGVPRVGHIPR
jgi:hypothetical protein